jgi:gamma-glutamyltranspeptidase/glutathione hydrolase
MKRPAKVRSRNCLRFAFGGHARALAVLAIPLAFGGALLRDSLRHRTEPKKACPAAVPAARSSRRAHFGVATQHPAATAAATAILSRGGSAGDAAIAAALTLGVAAPDCSGIGGGGFALVWSSSEHRATVLDFRETAPAKLDRAAFEAALHRRERQKRGELVGVPGELRGLFELHRRYGRLPWADDVAPAIDTAQNGYAAGPSLARNTYAYRREIGAVSLLRDLFIRPSIGPLPLGARVSNLPLAATLRAIADSGPDAFYRGAVAENIVESVRAAGGWIDVDDLANYRVVERQVLRTSWEGYDVLTVPPPSAGGMLLVETLKSTSRAQLRQLGLNTSAYVHELAELFRDALGDRVSAIGDPKFAPVDVESLANDGRMAHRKALIDPFATHALPAVNLDEHGTSHIVVVDDDANIVSLTTTIGDAFGSRVVAEPSGILLNDELVDFTSERQYEMFRSGPSPGPRTPTPPNAPRPTARPVSSMTPVIVLRGGVPVLALGGAGGLRIATGVTQALLARLAFDKAPAEAVSMSRFHTPYQGATVELEFGVDDSMVQGLRERGEKVEFFPNFSAVQMVSLTTSNGVLDRVEASADPRFGGQAEER